MKKILYIFSFTLALIAAASCQWKEADLTEINGGEKSGDFSLVEPNLLFGPDGGTNTLYLSAPSKVTVKSKASLLSFVVNSDNIQVTAKPNTEIMSRYAPITISQGSKTVSVTAQQSGVVLKDFKPANLTVTSKGGNYEIPFSSNTTMSVSSNKAFVKPSVVTDESGVTSIKIEVEENDTVDARTAVVTYAVGSRSGEITIDQAGAMVKTDNWVISYDGVVKVEKRNKDAVTVTVGAEDTGNYGLVVVPKADVTASGLDIEDYVVMTATPMIDSEKLTNATSTSYFDKFDNADYVAFAIGVNDSGKNSGYWQFFEFNINRDKTPYEKMIGQWTIKRGANTDTWTITAVEDDASFQIEGIEGYDEEYYTTNIDLTERRLVFDATYDVATETMTLSEQLLETWDDSFIGGTFAQDELRGFIYIGTDRYYLGDNAPLFTAKVSDDGNTMTLTPGKYYGVYDVAEFSVGFADENYGFFSYAWLLDLDDVPTTVPNTLTKK